MNWAELVPLAISRLAAARLRALLTMLGVIIGVASIVALVSVAQGATSGITNLIEGLMSKRMQPFSAYLVLSKTKAKADFEFPPR